MNRIDRSLWNDKTGTVVAPSENPGTESRRSAQGATPTAAGARFALTGLAASLMLAFGSNVDALPTGGAVSAGSASIAGSPGKVTVNQSTQNVAINWQSFNIAKTEAVQFVQPNSSAVALNRVLGADASSIMGSLSANGKVFLVNPSGILFGQGAQVNVGGLVASTRDISDGDFMAGNYRFAGTGNGAILNQGSINADGGYVALLGANVSNEGVISARLGTVTLAAGNAFTLDVAGDGLLNVAVDQGAVNALAQNGGLIRADGGQVLLTAMAAGNLLQSAVNNTGVIQAQTVENRNGTIRLLADMHSGTVSVGGTLDASGAGAGQTGGSVMVTGHHVGLFGGRIDASGDAGGGAVLVGGGYQGKNPALQNASATYMSADSTISADAVTNGSGGTVVVWANDSTRAYGSITARGGAQGGDGGLIETSGHWLDVSGIRIDASAPNGKRGMWLLDPADITISGAVTTGATLTANVFAPDSGVNSAIVNTTDLRNALQAGGGTDVTLTTTNTGASGNGAGDITVAAPLTWVVGGSATLTLNAAGDVNINADISMSNGNLVVCCGRDVNVRAAITAAGGGGSVLLTAGRDVRIERTIANPATDITVTNGNIALCAGRDVILSNTFNGAPLITMNDSGTGALGLGLSPGLVLSAGNAGTGPGAAGGTVRFTPGTLIALTRAAAPVLDVTVNYNPISYAVADRTDYSPLFTLVGAIALNERMLVFPDGATKTFDGTTTATLTGLKSIPAGIDVTLAGAGTASFDTAAVGLDKTVTFSGFTLAGADAGLFALPGAAICCTPAVQRTTGNITPAPVVVAPGVVAPEGTVGTGTVPYLAASMPFIPRDSIFPLELAGLSLTVLGGGLMMPTSQLAEAAPVETVPQSSAVAAPPAEKPAVERVVEPLPVKPSPVVAPPKTPIRVAPPKRPIRPDRQ